MEFKPFLKIAVLFCPHYFADLNLQKKCRGYYIILFTKPGHECLLIKRHTNSNVKWCEILPQPFSNMKLFYGMFNVNIVTLLLCLY